MTVRTTLRATCAAILLAAATLAWPETAHADEPLPALHVSPAAVAAGLVVTFSPDLPSGSCDNGGQHVRIAVSGDPTEYRVPVDDAGNWSFPYTPAVGFALGQHNVDATCLDYDDFNLFDYQIAVSRSAPCPLRRPWHPPVPAPRRSTQPCPSRTVGRPRCSTVRPR